MRVVSLFLQLLPKGCSQYLLSRGVGIITRRSHMPLKYFKHMKTYDGIMESSFMFFMQVSNIQVNP